MTDANLVLGRLAPRGLLGGRMALDPDAARAALAPLAQRLGFTLERTAHGMLGVVASNMVRAIRTISVERGHDPRRFTLMPFGGAGPLHAREVAEALGIRRILVPAAPGILCAQGLVVSDLKEDFVAGQRLPVERRRRERDPEPDRRVAAAGGGLVRTRGRAAGRPPLELSLDLRYVGQNFELPVPFEVQDLPDAAGLRGALLRGPRDRLRLPQPAGSGGGRELPPDRARPALPGAAAGEARGERGAARSRSERARSGSARIGAADPGLRARGARGGSAAARVPR